MAKTKSKKAAKTKERRMASARNRAETHKSGFDSHTIQKPEGYKWWQPKEGTYKINLIPFTAGEGNPFAEPGELYYERTFFVHRNIGPDDGMYICLAKTFNEKCAVCQHRKKLMSDEDADEAAAKELNWKERQIFLIQDLAEPDEKYIWDVSNHCFGKALDKKIRNGDEGEYDNFFDPDDGYYIRLSLEEDSFNGRSFLITADLEFKKRKQPLDEDLVENAPCLDDLVVHMTPDELKKVFLQDDEEEEDDKPAKGKAKEKAPAKGKGKKQALAADLGLEVGDTVEHEDHGTCEIAKISKDGTSLTLEDEDGEKHTGIAPNEVTKTGADLPDEDEEEDEEPEPPKKRGRGRPPKSESKAKKKVEEEEEEDEDEEEEEDDDDDEPAPPKKKRGRPPKKAAPVEDDEDDDDEEEDEDDEEEDAESDDWDDDDFDDDEDEDEDEPPRKKRK